MKKNKRSELVHLFIKRVTIQAVKCITKNWIGLIAAIYGKTNKFIS